ncbi:DUF4373 domain-containing protein [Bacteroides nordii]|uniref:DUF4373 domain-containing protein n=1 Tax=Bacteroides nordii TaxID=291645 RepID=UPI0004704898|nr:DUF4373 domain-containing protein [Bacteroides nordii]UAK42810.1 DUF4373 domain-containing protein [Bacteroides nordii]
MSKNGFSYYKAETDRYQDIKIKRLKKRYGCDGYAVYQYALNEIYRVEGCYIRWTEDQLFDCADYWGLSEARVKEIIDYCAEICLFNTLIWKNQCILTARAIQSRYLDICKVSKKKAYIPMDIILVEPQQEMKQPEPMPLFSAEVQPAAGTGQNAPMPETVFQNLPETFQNTPEYSGNIPEKNDKEKKKKENTPSIPPVRSGELSEEEAKKLLRSVGLDRNGICPAQAAAPPPPSDKPRNPHGLLEALKSFGLSQVELEEVLRLSRHGEIDNPVWGILNEIRTSKKIKFPRLFLLSRLRGAMGEVVKKAAAS